MNLSESVNAILAELFFSDRSTFVIGAILFFVLFFSFRQIVSILINGMINRSLAALSEHRPRVLNPGKTKRVLLIGDSTAFGTGAHHVEETLAGRFAHDFPHVEVVNYGVSGSLTRDVLAQLDQAADRHFNLVLISTGGNDIWHFTRLRKVREDIYKIISRAKEISDGKAILLIYNYVALAPAFPFFLRGVMRYRAEILDAMFLRAAQDFGIEAVEVFAREEQQALYKNSRKYFAADGIHPSGEGYRVWYVRLWGVLYMHNYGLHPELPALKAE